MSSKKDLSISSSFQSSAPVPLSKSLANLNDFDSVLSSSSSGSSSDSDENESKKVQDLPQEVEKNDEAEEFVSQILAQTVDPLEKHLRMMMSSRGIERIPLPSFSSVKAVRGDEEEEGEWEDFEEEGFESSEEGEEEEEAEEEEEPEDPVLVAQKEELIERYIQSKYRMKYLQKKNAWLQDRLFQSSAVTRRGSLNLDEHPEQLKHPVEPEERPEKDEIEFYGDFFESEPKGSEGSSHTSRTRSTQSGTTSGSGATRPKRGLGEIRTLELKYKKAIREIQLLDQSKTLLQLKHKQSLYDAKVREEEWLQKHDEELQKFLQEIRDVSAKAKDGDTGERLRMEEIEEGLGEFAKLHMRICGQLIKMYQNRRELNLAVKRLEETEVQGSGLSTLEYEQLQGENRVLKEKLEDKEAELEGIKGNIGHCVQILAHFREKLLNVAEGNVVKGEMLREVNQKVAELRGVNEGLGRRLVRVRKEATSLVVESGLINSSVNLLDDFEKSSYEVGELRNLRNRLRREYNLVHKGVGELRSKIGQVED